jgi:hypothetical protein
VVYLASLDSLKSLLSRTAFLGDKLADVFRCFMAHNFWKPLGVAGGMVRNVGLGDPREIFPFVTCMLHKNRCRLTYLMCPPRVPSVMLARVISAACHAAKSEVSSSGKSSRDSAISASMCSARESSSSR